MGFILDLVSSKRTHKSHIWWPMIYTSLSKKKRPNEESVCKQMLHVYNAIF